MGRRALGVCIGVAMLLFAATASADTQASPLLNTARLYPVASWAEAVAIGDVTGDGRSDVVMTTSNGNYADTSKDLRLFVFAQSANGTLAQPVSYATAAQYSKRPQSVAIGDITGDGRNDVVVAIDGLGVQVFPQVQNGLLGSPATTPTTDSYKIRLGRLNGDDRLDVVGVGWNTNTASVLLNDGNGGLQAPVAYPVLHNGYEDLEVADVSGDGREDLIVMNGQGTGANIGVLTQQAGGGFGSASYLSVPQGAFSLTKGIGVGDVTGDGRNDVIASYGGNAGQIAVFGQTSLGTLATTAVTYPTSSADAPGAVDVADLDQDGKSDVVMLHVGSAGPVGVFRQKADGTLAPEEIFATSYDSTFDPHELSVGDVSGDSVPDVVYASFNHGLVVLVNATAPPGSTVPDPPTLDSATPGKVSATLAWSPGSNGGASITGYRIYRGTAAGNETFLTTVGNQTSFTDTNVVGGTTYYYRVSAVNAVGEGAQSNELSATPSPATPPDATFLWAGPDYNAAVLSWSQPASNGAAITGYKIYRGLASGNETLLRQVQWPLTSFRDSSAVAGATYFYTVTAINSAGEGPASNEVSVTPLTPALPDAPVVEARTPTFGQVSLQWNVPASNDGTTISTWNVYRGTAPGAETLLTTMHGSPTYTDTSGVSGTTYYYEVTAVNSVGESARSNEASATPVSPVFQPYQAFAVGSWPNAVAVGDVTGDGRNDVVMTTGYYNDPANDFHLFVFAQNADGTLAAPVSYVTAAGYSSTPDSVAVGDVTGDGRADVVVGIRSVGIQVFPQTPSGTLGAPASVPSTNVTEIRLGQLDGDGRLDVAGTGKATEVFFNDGHGGLRAPVVYGGVGADLEIADMTNDGRDDLVVLTVSNVSVLAQLPGGFGSAVTYPTNSNSFGTSGIGVGDLNGDARSDVAVSYGGNRPSSFVTLLTQAADGALGPPVPFASYDIPGPVDVADLDLDGRADVVTLHKGWNQAGVYRGRLDGALGPEELYSIPYASSYLPHGLAVGDVNGDGSPDAVLADYNHGLVVLRNRTAPASVPRAPTLTAAIPGTGSVALTWNAPGSSGGSPTGYRVYRGTSSGAETLLATIGTATSYVDATANAGTTYYYRLSAVNSRGEGPPSNERSASPAFTPPGAPTLTAATAQSGGIALSWAPPALDGGTPVTGYVVSRGTASGAETALITLGNVASYTDTTVVSGTTYFYVVSAKNAVGEGARSTERSAQADLTAPSTPAGLKLVVAGTTQLALDWSLSTDNVGVIDYDVFRGGVRVATVSGSQYLDAGLAAGTIYSYQVRARDAAGNTSPLSSSQTAKTAAVLKNATGGLAGVVYDPAGEPVEGVVVRVTLANGNVKKATTSAAGVWRLDNLAPGTYTLTASLAGHPSATSTMTATAGTTVLAVTTIA